jgi:hypothetical protein
MQHQVIGRAWYMGRLAAIWRDGHVCSTKSVQFVISGRLRHRVGRGRVTQLMTVATWHDAPSRAV